MPSWRRGLRGAAAVVVLLHQSALVAAEARPSILMLLPGSPEVVPWADRFLLTLKVHLHPYGIDVQQARVELPPGIEEQGRLARRAGSRAGVMAVVWCTTATADRPAAVVVLDLRQPGTLVHSLVVGEQAAGLERSLAAAVRTLLLAAPLELTPPRRSSSRPVEPAEKRRPSVAARPPAPAPAPRLQLGAGYAMNGYPLGSELRHGPDFDLSVRLWRRLEGRFAVGYRLPRRGGDPRSQWSRSDLRLSWGVTNAWYLKGSLDVLAGMLASVSRVAAEAQDLATSRAERIILWEVSLGGRAGVGVRLGRRVRLELGAGVAWLPLRHSLVVRGTEVAGPGSLELWLDSGIRVGFF